MRVIVYFAESVEHFLLCAHKVFILSQFARHQLFQLLHLGVKFSFLHIILCLVCHGSLNDRPTSSQQFSLFTDEDLEFGNHLEYIFVDTFPRQLIKGLLKTIERVGWRARLLHQILHLRIQIKLENARISEHLQTVRV